MWGATLGLLFGVTGIVQDHRSILKIPTPRPLESTVQLPLPSPTPQSADDLAAWLQQTLGLDRQAGRIKREAAHAVAWGDKAVRQPEHWTAQFSSPRFTVQAEYWLGNGFVTVKRSDNGVLATLTNLHKGVGAGSGWILLADSIAGSLVVLSLTGVGLWLLTHRRRHIGLMIGGLSLATAISIALASL